MGLHMWNNTGKFFISGKYVIIFCIINLKHCSIAHNTVGLITDILKQIIKKIIIYLIASSSFSNTCTCITQNVPLGDITGSNLSDYMQLPRESQNALHYFFTYAVLLLQDL